MKTLKLSALALALGIFATSCGSNTEQSSTSTTDSTSITSPAPVPDQNTSPAMDTSTTGSATPPATTEPTKADAGKMEKANKGAHETTTAGKDMNGGKINGKTGAPAMDGAKSVSKVKTGNLNNIKSKIKRDSIDNNADFGAGK